MNTTDSMNNVNNNVNANVSGSANALYPSMMGLYYMAMLEIMKLDQQQMQAWLEYTKKMAAAYGGTDSHGDGLLKMQLEYAFKSADNQADAMKTEAWGSFAAAIVGGTMLVGAGTSAWMHGTGALEKQIEGHNDFEKGMKGQSDARIVVQGGEENLNSLTSHELKQRIQGTRTEIEGVNKEIEELNADQERGGVIGEELVTANTRKTALETRLKGEENTWMLKKFENLAEDREAMQDFVTTNSEGIKKEEFQQHLKMNPELAKKVQAHNKEVRKSAEDQMQSLSNSHQAKIRYLDIVNTGGSQIAQGSGKTAAAVPQSESSKQKALSDVQQTLNQSVSQTISAAQSAAGDAKSKADNDAAAYAQVGK